VAVQRVLLQTRPTGSSPSVPARADGRAANPSDRVFRADCKLAGPFSTALDFFSFFIKKKTKKID
jgi:hypothetical protein